MADFLRALLCLTVIVDFFLALMVIKSNSKKLENRFFAVFLFAAVFWSIGDALMLYADTYETARAGVILFYVAPLITTLFVLLFSLVFPNNRPIRARTAIIFAIPTLVIFLAMSINTDLFLQGIVLNPEGQNLVTHHAKPYQIYSLYFNAYFVVAYILLIRSYRRSQGDTKKRVGYALWSILVTSILALFTNLTLPIAGKNEYVFAGPMFMLFFAVVVTMGIIRYRFLDIRLVVARSLGYLLSVVTLAAIYGFVAFNVVNELVFSGEEIVFVQRVAFTILAVIIAFTFQPLRQFFDRLTNKLFYQDAYSPQNFLDGLNQVLVSTIDLGAMLHSTGRVVESNLKSEFCAFAIHRTAYEGHRVIGDTGVLHGGKISEDLAELTTGGEKIWVTDGLEGQPELKRLLEKNRIAVLVKLASSASANAEGVGYLMLGAKKSGNPYNSQDIKVLEIVANELVIAIQNALRFEEIQKFNITLQEQIEQATGQLKRTNEKLRALDETKDDFISMASHQLRTPLTSVKGYLSMVLEGDAGKIDAKQAKLLNQAFISSERMVYLIADLLNVSRLKTGKFIIEPTPVNLAEVISSEVVQLVETAEARGLKLAFEKPKHFPTLMFDETKIRQVIMNFIDNAIYYTPAGGHIIVKLEESSESISLKVVDEGIGVPKHEQPHLFTKFFRAGNARKARPDGTGLGLFMAKKVIIAQGGSLIFRSTEGRGSTFGFTFAKARLKPPAGAEAAAEPQAQ